MDNSTFDPVGIDAKDDSLANPYKVPDTGLPQMDGVTVTKRSGAKVFSAALSLLLVGATVVPGVYWLIGFPNWPPLIEVSVWLLFTFGMALVFSRLMVPTQAAERGNVDTKQWVLQWTFALASFSILAIQMYLATHAWILSGNVYERFAFYQRAFGEYHWIYWLTIGLLGILPQLFWSFRILKRRASAVPVLLFVCLASAFYLRVNYGINNSEHLPSSFQELLWPF